ncbi:LpqB family beta-propeller domain-containing protein [Streptomyces sp. JJ36]|uniref:LpqB family beta-propeller domain-containing protein n=1 Tax=Streptomyces sp. JJ36 TaxID=2736645 RepID=UPI001F44F255|nr:LpqB family beta-propeller domain-containing protein [Streptomyces sp. JJ36]MCF6526392.1 GerMN domain-containing protein [Streptomyces sp. JJ36]
MGAERRRRTGAVVLALTFVLSGCASMPGSGPVTPVDSAPRTEGDSRVRVFGVSPQKDEDPQDIVRGFLEATTSDEPDLSTAKEYLTQETAEAWDPFAGTTVLAGGPATGVREEDPDGKGSVVEVSGTRTARVDGRHAYDPDHGEYTRDFHLTETKEGWRIDMLPDGLVLGESDFQRIYRSVNTYYFARLGPDGASVVSGEKVLVADPVYLRGRIDPVTEAVRSLLEGPTVWLGPVVSSAFPDGTRLARGERLSLDDSGGLDVRLNKEGAQAGKRQCARMAAQLLHTVQSQASAKVTRVRLAGPGGTTVCELSRQEAELYAPGRLSGRGEGQYFIDGRSRVATTLPGEEPKVVEGALGSEVLRFGSVGVSRDERQAAAVTLDGRQLFVSALAPDGKLGEPMVVSHAAKEADGLSAPSWDGLGDLWIADRDPRNPRLLRLRGGKEEPEEVDVPSLGKNERIESLRVSSDGVRIAMRVREADGRRTLKLGRVQRGGTREDPEVAVAAARSVAPQLQDVVTASWAGPSQLAVVGRESHSAQQLQYVGTDGSTANQPALPGINDVEQIAASEEEGSALLAETKLGIFRLPPDSNWKTVAEEGTAPVYPG